MMRKLMTAGLMAGLFILSACGSGSSASGPEIVSMSPLAGGPGTTVTVSFKNYDPTKDTITFGAVPVLALASPMSRQLTKVSAPAPAGSTNTDGAVVRYITVPTMADGIFEVAISRGNQVSDSRQFQVISADLAGAGGGSTSSSSSGGSGSTSSSSSGGGSTSSGSTSSSSSGGIKTSSSSSSGGSTSTSSSGGLSSTSSSSSSSSSSSGGTPPSPTHTSVVSFHVYSAGSYDVSAEIDASYVKSLLLVAPVGDKDPFSYYPGEFLGNTESPFGKAAVKGIEDLLGLTDLYAPTTHVGYSPMNYCNIAAEDQTQKLSFVAGSLCFNGKAPLAAGSEAYNYIGIFLPVNSGGDSKGKILLDAPYIDNAFTLYYRDWSGKMQSRSVTVN